MAYKFKVGHKTIEKILDEIRKSGHDTELSQELKNFNAGTDIDRNGRLTQSDPGLQNFSATSEIEIDSTSLEAIQQLIVRNGLDQQNALLGRVARASPPNCNPPYDCGNTILS